MATLSIAGRKATIIASTGATSTAAGNSKIGELKNWTLNISAADINVTSHDSSNWHELLPGKRTGTFSADALLLTTHAGHKIVRNAILNSNGGAKLAFAFQMTTSVSAKVYKGVGYITDYSPSAPTEDAVLAKIGGHITGSVAYTS